MLGADGTSKDLIVQMGSAVAEQAASKGVRVAGAIGKGVRVAGARRKPPRSRR